MKVMLSSNEPWLITVHYEQRDENKANLDQQRRSRAHFSCFQSQSIPH